VEFLGTSSLEILNQGNEPFCNGYRSEVIDHSSLVLMGMDFILLSVGGSL
jgi:hypothetical protein